MIESLVLSTFAFVLVCYCAAALVSDRISTRKITCLCGRRQTHKALIVDPGDPKRIADTLSETCPTCRTIRALNRKAEADQAAAEKKRKRVNVRAAMKYYREQLPVASRQSSAPHTEISHVDH